MTWSSNLLEEYKKSRQQLRKKISTLNKAIEKDEDDIKLLNAGIRDITFIIEWLEFGIEPNHDHTTRQGKERAFTYENNFVYGVTGYWDESMNGFISKASYDDDYLKADERMDKELEAKRYEAARVVS